MSTRPGRLFFGIWPDEPSQQRLAAWQRSVAWPAGARCTSVPDLHLTLPAPRRLALEYQMRQWLGYVPDDAGLARLVDAVRTDPESLTLDELRAIASLPA